MDHGEIRDPIHGNIEMDETETKIINTPEMQRLRYIKQLDMSYLVFPGANHSRFEHSLGAMQVTKELVHAIYGDKNSEFSYVGLLHDIGHGPFSHLTESIIKKYLKSGHEQIGEKIIRGSEIKDILSDSGFEFDKIMSYFRDANKIEVVGGPLGSDRIDYLMRDSHYTGVAYGVIDYERLKSRLVLFNDRIAILESGISGAESVLIARYFMHTNVYSHHAKLIAAKMLQKAVEFCLEAGAFDANELLRMHDEELMLKIMDSNVKEASDLASMIKERRLFKRAYYGKVGKDIDTAELVEKVRSAGFGDHEFVVHMRVLGGGDDDVEVVSENGGRVGRLTDVSPLIKTLTGVLADSRILIVACDKRNAQKIGEIARKFVAD